MKTRPAWAFLLLLLSGCGETPFKKDCARNCVTIRGRVATGHLSAVEVPGMKLEVSWSRNSWVSLFGPKQIAQTTTGKNGHYQFTFSPSDYELKEGSYEIKYAREGYQAGRVSLYEVGHGKTDVVKNIHVIQGGQLRVRVLNYPTPPPADSIGIDVYYHSGISQGHGALILDPQGNALNGPVYNLPGFTCRVAANQYAYLQIFRRRNGQWQQSTDSVFCEAGEETLYQYKY